MICDAFEKYYISLSRIKKMKLLIRENLSINIITSKYSWQKCYKKKKNSKKQLPSSSFSCEKLHC